MGKFLSAPLIAAAFLMTFTAAPVWAGHVANTVKVTPLGSHDGQFCRRDRAIVFEDGNGTRILYDAGRTVRGSGDSRLAPGIDVVLLSSVHGDHIGDRIEAAQEASPADCRTAIDVTPTTPDSNTAEIVAGTGAQVYVGGEMRNFLRAKIADAGGSSGQAHTLRPGASIVVGTDGEEVAEEGDPGVEISTVMAVHSNGIGREFLTGRLLTNPQGLTSDGLSAYAGPDHGYVLKFTNDLVVYMSADTGHTSDMSLIVKGFYGAKLAVLNIGDEFSMGPKEAAFAALTLIEPASVIPSHANERATSGGSIIADTKTERFFDLVNPTIPVHVPLSDITMEFDGTGLRVH